MRWLKHLTTAKDDEKIALLISECGHAAYGLWWMVLELVGREMDTKSGKCSLTYPASKWAAELYLRPQDVRSKLSAIGLDRGAGALLKLSWDGSKITAEIPNLLKYRDEYSRKSGQSPDTLPILSHAKAAADRNTERKAEADRAPRGTLLASEDLKSAAAIALAACPPEMRAKMQAFLDQASGRIAMADNPVGLARHIVTEELAKAGKKPTKAAKSHVNGAVPREEDPNWVGDYNALLAQARKMQ
jgi:hypothetical protein